MAAIPVLGGLRQRFRSLRPAWDRQKSGRRVGGHAHKEHYGDILCMWLQGEANLSVVEIRNEVESILLAFLMTRDMGHAGEEGKPVVIVAGHCLFIALEQIVC